MNVVVARFTARLSPLRECEWPGCGELLPPDISTRPGRKRRFCSARCRQRASRDNRRKLLTAE